VPLFIASIIGSGINGNANLRKLPSQHSNIASIIGSGINGNQPSLPHLPSINSNLASLLLLEVELMETGINLTIGNDEIWYKIASIIGSGINGNQ